MNELYEKSLRTLELDRVLDILSENCVTDEGKDRAKKLLPYLDEWIATQKTYTVRFAIGMYMAHFLDADFEIAYAEKIAEIQSEEYYVNMMRAWYFATALAKQYDAVIGFLTENRLDVWTHNKTIQKCVESYRISDERKEYLKTLKIRQR